MRGNVAHGARGVKMKVGGVDPRVDAERVRIVRDAVGPDVKVLIDANGAYRAHEAIAFARLIEPFDVFWFEEPVSPDDYQGQALVARSTIIPVASGENEYTRFGFRDLIESRSASILNADAQILGGVTEFMKVVALAQTYDLPVAPHGNQDIHVHLVAAIANGLIVEYYRDTVDPMWGRFLRQHLKLDDGFVSPPDRPGFGLEIDEEAVAAYRVI